MVWRKSQKPRRIGINPLRPRGHIRATMNLRPAGGAAARPGGHSNCADFVQKPKAWALGMKRFLAIEELGTSFQPEKRVPLVRLKGHWLKAAGFAAGNRVTVTCLSPGVIELRAGDMPQTPEPCAAQLVNRRTA